MRGFRAVYLGLLFNCVIMASVNLAAVKIAQVLLGWSPVKTLVICGALSILYAAPAATVVDQPAWAGRAALAGRPCPSMTP